MPILQDVISDWVEDHNTAPIRPQRLRRLPVPGIPNDLYRGSPNAPKQGFDFDGELEKSYELQIETDPINLPSLLDRNPPCQRYNAVVVS
jgi:hypothetical protein